MDGFMTGLRKRDFLQWFRPIVIVAILQGHLLKNGWFDYKRILVRFGTSIIEVEYAWGDDVNRVDHVDITKFSFLLWPHIYTIELGASDKARTLFWTEARTNTHTDAWMCGDV